MLLVFISILLSVTSSVGHFFDGSLPFGKWLLSPPLPPPLELELRERPAEPAELLCKAQQLLVIKAVTLELELELLVP